MSIHCMRIVALFLLPESGKTKKIIYGALVIRKGRERAYFVKGALCLDLVYRWFVRTLKL